MDGRSKVDYDSLKYRKTLWEKEYSKSKDLPSSNTTHPSSSLRIFLESYKGPKDLAIDIGSGNGRNSIFLSQNGFKKIISNELSTEAYTLSISNANNLDIKNITFHNDSISKGIHAKDNSADLIIDMMCMHSFSKEERQNEFDEIKRVLKPGGKFLFFTLERNSPAAQELIKKWQGPEEGSYRFKVDGIVHTEKTFNKNELTKLLHPLNITYWEETQHDTKAFNNVYSRVYIFGVAEKKK